MGSVILTRHFVFIHLPKTGGTFFTRLVERHAPGDWDVRIVPGHPTTRDIPAGHRELPLVGMIRDPWSFYVSWYTFLRERVDDYDYFNRVSDHGRLSFADTLRNIMTSPEVGDRGWGGYTALINHTYRERVDEVRYVRMERLREDLLRVLGAIVAIPPPLERAIRAAPPINTSGHGDVRRYYDRELVDLVWERDRLVFETFGYPRLEL